MIDRLYQRLLMMIGRGRVTTGRDDGNIQMLQVNLDASDTRDNAPRLAEYGFTSMPPEGSDAVLIFMGGDRSNGVIIATGNQTYRLKNLAPGEVAVYDNLGKSIYLSAAGIVVQAGGQPVTVENASTVTVTANTSVTLNTPATKVTGTLEVDGNATFKGTAAVTGALSSATSVADPKGTMDAMRTVHNDHDHPVTGVAAGTATVTSNTPNQLM